MSEMTNKSEEQEDAEAEVERFRKELGPFVVAAETTRMAMVFTDAKAPSCRLRVPRLAERRCTRGCAAMPAAPKSGFVPSNVELCDETSRLRYLAADPASKALRSFDQRRFDDFGFGRTASIAIECVDLQPLAGRMRLDDGKGRCPATNGAHVPD
jgi:hypothetical protein